jgi:hypothetical protein
LRCLFLAFGLLAFPSTSLCRNQLGSLFLSMLHNFRLLKAHCKLSIRVHLAGGLLTLCLITMGGLLPSL